MLVVDMGNNRGTDGGCVIGLLTISILSMSRPDFRRFFSDPRFPEIVSSGVLVLTASTNRDGLVRAVEAFGVVGAVCVVAPESIRGKVVLHCLGTLVSADVPPGIRCERDSGFRETISVSFDLELLGVDSLVADLEGRSNPLDGVDESFEVSEYEVIISTVP